MLKRFSRSGIQFDSVSTRFTRLYKRVFLFSLYLFVSFDCCEFGYRYQCSPLPEEAHLQSDLLCVKCNLLSDLCSTVIC